ncbi:hypothetical protein IKQ26_07330 [bacterium]|nr:hypothetical protein [bacterium]
MFNIKKYFNPEIIYWFGIFALLIYLFLGNVLCADDIYFNFLDRAEITMKREYYYGSWVMPVQNFLMYYLPYKLSINLQDWAQTFGAVIEALSITLLIKYFSKFFSLSEIQRKTNLILTSISFMFLFFLLKLLKFKDIIIYSGFFRFLLPSVLLVVWLYYFYKIIKNKKVNLIFFCAFSLLTMSSSEVAGGILVCSSVLYFLYLLISKREIHKKQWTIFAFALFGLLVLLLSKGFQYHFSAKLENNIFDFSVLSNNLLPFLKVYLYNMFLQNGLFLVAFGGLIWLNGKKHNFDEVFLSLALIISVFLFAFSLILLGRTHYETGFWVSHSDLYTVFYIVYTTVFIILSVPLIKFFETQKENNILKNLLIFLFLPLFILSCVHIKTSVSNIKDFTYLRDKMTLFYLENGDDIVLPYACHTHNVYMLINNTYINFNSFLKNYKRTSDKKEIKMIEEVYPRMFKSYYPLIYNYDLKGKNTSVTFVKGREAMNFFEYRGGRYSEIKNHKYHFSDLERRN